MLLVQMYLVKYAVFEFLIGAEVNDDAVRVKTLLDLALQKYSALPKEQLKLAISNEFSKGYRDNDSYRVTFAYAELEDFTFSFDLDQYEGVERTLTLFGQGKYAGIMIQASVAGQPYFYVSGGIQYEFTDGARKIAQLLEKKFDFIEMNKKLADFGFEDQKR